MSVVDWLFGLCGFVRKQPPIRELIVFDSLEAARAAGFRGQEHPQYPNLIAWWPARGAAGLTWRQIQRVTLSRSATRTLTDEGSMRAILRARQAAYGDEKLWIEL